MGIPLLETTDAVRITDAPSNVYGNNSCTVKNTPLTFMSKVLSNSSEDVAPKELFSAIPALVFVAVENFESGSFTEGHNGQRKGSVPAHWCNPDKSGSGRNGAFLELVFM